MARQPIGPEQFGALGSAIKERIPGVAELLTNRIPGAARKAIEKYEQIPPVLRLGITLIVVPALIGILAKLAARRFAEPKVDQDEIERETSKVVSEYEQVVDKRGLATTYLEGETGDYVNRGRKTDPVSKVFFNTVALLNNQEFTNKLGLDSNVTDRLASGVIATRLDGSLNTLSGLLAVIPDANAFLEDLDSDVNRWTKGAESLGSEFAHSAAANPENTLKLFSHALGTAREKYAEEQSKISEREITRQTKEQLTRKFAASGIAIPDANPDNVALYLSILDELANRKVVSRKKGGNRRKGEYDEAQTKAVRDAIMSVALERSFETRGAENPTMAENTARLAQFISIAGLDLAEKAAANEAAKANAGKTSKK